jgi:lysozyme
MADRAIGVDLSHWHPATDWGAILASGISFVGAKATEGIGNTDPKFVAHRDSARSQAITLAVYYHLARAGDPVAEAKRFLEVVGPMQPNERLALDTERTSAVDIGWIGLFFKALPQDRRHLLYTSAGVWTAIGNPPFAAAAGIDLWLPRYGTTQEPVVPNPWKAWTIWQNAQDATVPGVDGPCDTNVFNGDIAALRAYVASSGAPLTS